MSKWAWAQQIANIVLGAVVWCQFADGVLWFYVFCIWLVNALIPRIGVLAEY